MSGNKILQNMNLAEKGKQMNARSRSEAIKGLENLAFIITVHLVLVRSFPGQSALKHWQGELDGFVKTLRRYNKATGKRKSNYTEELIRLSLSEIIEDISMQEDIEDFIAAKGLPIDGVIFAIDDDIQSFSSQILDI